MRGPAHAEQPGDGVGLVARQLLEGERRAVADPDWDWHSAAEDSPEQLHALWQDAVARSLVAEALADGGLEPLARRT